MPRCLSPSAGTLALVACLATSSLAAAAPPAAPAHLPPGSRAFAHAFWEVAETIEENSVVQPAAAGSLPTGPARLPHQRRDGAHRRGPRRRPAGPQAGPHRRPTQLGRCAIQNLKEFSPNRELSL